MFPINCALYGIVGVIGLMVAKDFCLKIPALPLHFRCFYISQHNTLGHNHSVRFGLAVTPGLLRGMGSLVCLDREISFLHRAFRAKCSGHLAVPWLCVACAPLPKLAHSALDIAAAVFPCWKTFFCSAQKKDSFVTGHRG